jgi:hypothetical protein
MTAPSNTDMDTTEDSPSTTDPVPMDLLSPSPSGDTSFSPSPPVQSPVREDDVSHSFTENGRTSEIPPQTSPPFHDDPGCDSPAALSSSARPPAESVPPQTSPPFHDDPGCDSPAALSSSARPPAESPLPSRPSTPTPGTLLSPPLLGNAGSDVFDLTGVNGDFISKDTCVHWESVPGGEKWVALVRSYLKLEAITPIKGVSRVIRHSIYNKLTVASSNVSDLGGHPGHKSYEPG